MTVTADALVWGLPYWSWLCTVIVPDTAPAPTVTGEVVIASLLAAAALTVSTWVAEVMMLGDVLAAVIVGVPACVSV